MYKTKQKPLFNKTNNPTGLNEKTIHLQYNYNVSVSAERSMFYELFMNRILTPQSLQHTQYQN